MARNRGAAAAVAALVCGTRPPPPPRRGAACLRPRVESADGAVSTVCVRFMRWTNSGRDGAQRHPDHNVPGASGHAVHVGRRGGRQRTANGTVALTVGVVRFGECLSRASISVTGSGFTDVPTGSLAALHVGDPAAAAAAACSANVVDAAHLAAQACTVPAALNGTVFLSLRAPNGTVVLPASADTAVATALQALDAATGPGARPKTCWNGRANADGGSVG